MVSLPILYKTCFCIRSQFSAWALTSSLGIADVKGNQQKDNGDTTLHLELSVFALPSPAFFLNVHNSPPFLLSQSQSRCEFGGAQGRSALSEKRKEKMQENNAVKRKLMFTFCL